MISITNRDWLSNTRLACLCFIILLSILIRLALYQQFPALLTADSWDYIGAAEDILYRADFYSSYLRDVRMPAYSTLLALTRPLTGMLSNRIVLMQKIIGLASVVLGLTVGLRLRSWPVAEILALFFGLNPVYLLFEHTVMPDTFFLFSLIGLIAFALFCLKGQLNWRKAAILGIVSSICVLTRANALPLCAVLMIGIVLVRFIYRKASSPLASSRRDLIVFSIVLALTSLLIAVPWLWRNYDLFGNISLVNFNSRNLLIYKAMHDPLDLSLPLMKAVNKSLSADDLEYLDYDWLWRLARVYPTNEAEKVARHLLWEQITNDPDRHVVEMLETFVSLGGFYAPLGTDRFAVRWWFMNLVNNVDMVYKVSTPAWTKTWNSDFVYIQMGSDTPLTQLWSRAGVWYFSIARPVISALFLILAVLYLVCRRTTLAAVRNEFQDYAIWICGFGYLITVLGHTVTLTDNDRYAASYDLISLLVSLSVVAYFVVSRHRMRLAQDRSEDRGT